MHDEFCMHGYIMVNGYDVCDTLPGSPSGHLESPLMAAYQILAQASFGWDGDSRGGILAI